MKDVRISSRGIDKIGENDLDKLKIEIQTDSIPNKNSIRSLKRQKTQTLRKGWGLTRSRKGLTRSRKKKFNGINKIYIKKYNKKKYTEEAHMG